MDRKRYLEGVESFLKESHIAVAGYSHTGKQPANGIYDRLKEAGYTVYAINPKHDQIGDVTCYPDLKSCPELPGAIVCAAPPEATVELIREGLAFGINKFWIHRGIDNGSYHPEAEDLCTEAGALCLTSGCPLMFVNPDPFHRLLKTIMKWRGKLEVCPMAEMEMV